MKKYAFLFAVIAILSILLSACQPQAATPTTTPAATEPPTAAPTEAPVKEVTITYWAFGSEGSAMNASGELWTDWYAKIFKQYEADHPGVTVDFAVKGYDASGTTLFIDTAVAAGTPPDIYFDTKFRVKKYFDAGLLEDLTPALTDADLAAYDKAVFAGGKSGT
jgi:ABC-type glycerol-3-phosphate transport system substrate-binding protein